MIPFWTGIVSLRDGDPLDPPKLELYNGHQGLEISANSSLKLLSFVDCAKIPLHIICGPAYEVIGRKSWIHEVVLESIAGTEDVDGCGSSAEPLQSFLGALLRVDQDVAATRYKDAAEVTELLLYAKLEDESSSETDQVATTGTLRSGPPIVRFFALPLSSHLLYQASRYEMPPTPPPDNTGILLLPLDADQMVKRRRLDDLFEGASRPKKRSKQQESGNDKSSNASIAVLQAAETQSVANGGRITGHQATEQSTRSHSRAHSVSSLREDRPLSRGSNFHKAKSSLSRVASSGGLSQSASNAMAITGLSQSASSMETKNKKTLSNMVMSSMRLRGMSQRKIETTMPEDSDYKLMYHNTFKAANFALRADMQAEIRPDSMRDVVDLLLDLFCGIVGSGADGDAGGGGSGIGSFDMTQRTTPNEEKS